MTESESPPTRPPTSFAVYAVGGTVLWFFVELAKSGVSAHFGEEPVDWGREFVGALVGAPIVGLLMAALSLWMDRRKARQTSP